MKRKLHLPRIDGVFGALKTDCLLKSMKSLKILLLTLGVAGWACSSSAQQTSLKFSGSSSYVNFGQATSTLGATNFTIECWFKRVGTGSTASTGTGGISGVPLVTKGRGESESPSLNCNYFLAHTSGNLLIADFEEVTGPNHPLTGTHAFSSNVWHHAALTYDGTALKLYLDGVLDNSVAATGIPDYTSIQPAGLATAFSSAGAGAGFFAGLIDEARIWNYARTQTQIQNAMRTEITSATGLLGRWGLNDGAGTVASNSVAGSPDGTLFGATTWIDDSPFLVAAQSVTLTNPVDNAAVALGSTITLRATATMTNSVSTVEFFAGNVSLGVSTTSPYTVDWTPSTIGRVPLTAVATDINGQTLTSAIVNALCYEPGTGALQFNGYSSYVTFGPATNTLGLSNFTLECWIKRTGKGVIANTGVGGTSGSPIITKGEGEADANNRDCNYFLGVDSSGRLVADFEEGANGAVPGLNHPIGGRTAVVNGVWTHVAATYDGFQWALYVNGVLDGNLEVSAPPRSDSIQHAALGAALNSSGSAGGYFEGVMDEARIWNYARSPEQIANSMNTAITNATGLVGRWGLDDAAGSIALDSVASSPNGTLANSPVWCLGLDLAPATNTPPSAVLSSPADGSTILGIATNLTVLHAFAADDGTVTNLSFYQDNLLLATLASGPFDLVWTNITPGNYNLRVVAVDNTGLITTSAVVNVTIVTPNYPPVITAHSPLDGALVTSLASQLNLSASDPEGSSLHVNFLGRLDVTNPPGPDFTIVALPDTQYYSAQYPDIFQSQIDWIIANRVDLNIVYVAGLGDIVNDGDALPNEWLGATNALYRLDSPDLTGLPDGIPYGTVPGNHDHNNGYGGTTLYNTYFGVDHFIHRPWYGGHLGNDNQNHFDLISASGLDFVFLYVDFNYQFIDYTQIDPWSDSVLQAYATRRAIVVSHDLLAATGGQDPRGYAIYNNLKNNQNLFLMLCGHNHGQYYRTDTNGTQIISTCLSDYQDFPLGGNGYLRLYQFSPSNNVIHVSTYSPYLGQNLGSFNNSPSQFDIPYTMDNAKPPFQLLSSTNVPSASTASFLWSGLALNSNYEWYATVSDGVNTVSLPANTFRTPAQTNLVPVLQGCFAPGSGSALFRARYLGSPGATYTIERAPRISGPWTWNANVTVPTVDQGLGLGVFEFSESPGTNSQAFFRLVSPSYPKP
jgi:Concanavalin A-like lectin/glucanases superfamily/Bacterial Ig domain